MRVIVVTCICLGLLAACGPKENKDMVPFETMRHLFLDIMKADEYYSKLTARDSLRKLQDENFRLYDQLFRSYGVTREAFYKTYKYYEAHPEEFKILIDSVDATVVKERTNSYQRYNTQPVKKP